MDFAYVGLAHRVSLTAACFAAAVGGCGPAIAVDPMHDDTSTGPASTGVGEVTSVGEVDSGPASTSSGSTTAMGTTDEGDSGSAFIWGDLGCRVAPVGTSFHCTKIECDPFEQNCPEGEKCTPWANDGGAVWNSTKCTPIDPDANEVGEPCVVEGSPVSGVDSCVEGAMCFDVDLDTLEGECVALCSGTLSDPTCADGMMCAVYNDGNLPLCLAFCDPLASMCSEGWTCEPTLDTLACLPGDGISCGATSCPADETCVPADALPSCLGPEPCCSPWCDVNDPDACTQLGNGETCAPWFSEGNAPEGLEHVGVCALAP